MRQRPRPNSPYLIMPNETYLPPDPGPDGWSPTYLAILRQAADKIVPNPALTTSDGLVVWQMMTEAERDRALEILEPHHKIVRAAEERDRAENTPESYLDEIVTRRRYGWLQRWINMWVVMQREADR